MKLDKGFHNGSVAWQVHDHEVEERTKRDRKIKREETK